MKKIVLISMFSLVSVISFSQDRKIDSLKHLLATTKDDTTRVMALVNLSFRAWGIDTCLKKDAEAHRL